MNYIAVERNKEEYYKKNISNQVLFHLLNDYRTKSLKEYGSIIDSKGIKFLINIDTSPRIVKTVINEAIGSDKLGIYTFILSLKYKISFKFAIKSKKITNQELANCHSYYFKPQASKEKYLFKYFRIDDNFISSIKENYIWFSNPQNFSDPFDCRTLFDTEVSKVNITKFYFTKFVQENLHNNITIEEFSKSFDVPTKECFETDLENYHFKNTFSFLGISCFTEEYNNKLMWSHYADGHKGVCLVFDLELLRVNNSDYYEFKGNKVKYSNTRPKVYFDASGEMDITSLVFTKSTEYMYENEVREIVNFQNREIQRKVKFQPNALKGILFGSKCTDDEKHRLKKMVEDCNQYSNVAFINTSIDIKNNIVQIDNGNNLLLNL